MWRHLSEAGKGRVLVPPSERTPQIPTELVSEFADYLADNTGWVFPPNRRYDLMRNAEAATAALGFADVVSCMRHLISTRWTTDEIQTLATYFTVGESWFYRNKDDFDNLSKLILPPLIEKRRHAGKTLRFWSAGCCTGEEPYTLATYLTDCIPRVGNWQASILATDINPRFLRAAEAGSYREWSFRTTPKYLRSRFFEEQADGSCHIIPAIKKMVKFDYLNLVQHSYPSVAGGTKDIDVIFLRNVLIYFGSDQIQRILKRMSDALAPDGVLIVSACESSLCPSELFVKQSDASTTIFRKRRPGEDRRGRALVEEPERHSSIPRTRRIPKPESRTELSVEKSAEGQYAVAEKLYKAGSYEEACELFERFVTEYPRGIYAKTALELIARGYANLGRQRDALVACKSAIAANKLNPRLHYLLASIHQEAGDIELAVESLNRTLYFDGGYVIAHFMLGTLLQKKNEPQKAKRHFKSALRLLHDLGDDELVDDADDITVGRLRLIIESVIANAKGSANGRE